jgi:ABC-2 type transport system permease protein
MQPVANNQPFTIFSNAMRSLLLGGADAVALGHSTAYWVILSFVWCAGILIVFSTMPVSGFARRR